MGKSIMPTVIIPVLNNPMGLARCIEAIRQSGTEFELVVVDNGSSDETLSVARRYTDLVLERPGLTVGAMRNEGARLASGQVLVFTDSDQEPSQDWLALGIRALGSDLRVGMVGARYHALPGSGWVASTWDLQRRFSDRAGDIGWLEAGNIFARREVFEQVGGFRTDLIASEDVDLSFRIRRAGYRVVCDPRIVNYHHGDPRTLLEFFRKERWRGSSGWKAWATQGYPLSELPGLLWPFWVVRGLAGLLTWTIMQRNRLAWNSISLLVAIGLICWMLPAIIRSLRACLGRPNFWFYSMAMSVLFLVYGLARFASIIRWSKNRIS